MAEGDGAAQVFKEVKISFDDFAESFNSYADRLKETEEIWRSKASIWKSMAIGGSDSPTTPSSNDNTSNDLARRYQLESMRYYKDFHAISTSIGKGVGGGLYGLATGEGLMGFSRGLMDFGRAVRGSGSFSQLLTGMAVGRGARRAGAAAEGAAIAETEAGGAEIAEAVKVGASTGIGIGLIQAFQKLPSVVKLGIGAIATFAGLDIAGMTLASKDVYGRSRRAGGFGANVGELTAFEDTMGRFVDTGSTMAAMRAAKYDITSPAYVALRAGLGMNPRDWKDPAAMAEGSILATQTWLKRYGAQHGEGTLLSAAHARGLGHLFSDEDLIRLYSGSQDEVNRMVKLAQSKAAGLDIPADQQVAYKDLVTNITLAGDDLKTFGENVLSVQIPTFNKWAKTLEDWIKKYQNPGAIDQDQQEQQSGPGGGSHVPLGIRMRGSGRSYGANTRTGGGAGGGSLTFAASKNMSPEERALLDVMAYGESGAKSYLSGDPDRGAAFQGNRYQFLGATWASNARAIGADPSDLSPENQDRVALHLIKSLAGNRLEEIIKNPALIKGIFGPTWHGVRTFNAAAVFQKALEEERNRSSMPDQVKKAVDSKVPKGHFHIHDPNKDPLTSHEYPAPGEKTSMNDLRNYQGAQPRHFVRLNVNNQAGANVIVQGGMLGAGSGQFQVA
jgi:hypothetical protein